MKPKIEICLRQCAGLSGGPSGRRRPDRAEFRAGLRRLNPLAGESDSGETEGDAADHRDGAPGRGAGFASATLNLKSCLPTPSRFKSGRRRFGLRRAESRPHDPGRADPGDDRFSPSLRQGIRFPPGL